MIASAHCLVIRPLSPVTSECRLSKQGLIVHDRCWQGDENRLVGEMYNTGTTKMIESAPGNQKRKTHTVISYTDLRDLGKNRGYVKRGTIMQLTGDAPIWVVQVHRTILEVVSLPPSHTHVHTYTVSFSAFSVLGSLPLDQVRSSLASLGRNGAIVMPLVK